MMHVQAGNALLAYYQDSFYRGFCLRVLASEAEIWFADYGNIAHVKKTDLRTLPKVRQCCGLTALRFMSNF